MVFDSKFQAIRDYFGIWNVADWCGVTPAQILSVETVGPKTLAHIRMYLAARGLTLKDDRTAEHWKKHLSGVEICQMLGDPEEGDDQSILPEFEIVIDTAEQEPFAFSGIKSDADRGKRNLIVPTVRECLGRHPNSLGDYTIRGCGVDGFGRCHIERKSKKDGQSTILGFAGGARDRFESELSNLAECPAPLVLIECPIEEFLGDAPSYGVRTKEENARTLFRSAIALQMRYRVQWIFAPSRRAAEVTAFRWLEKWWREELAKKTAEAKREMRDERERQKAREQNMGGEKPEQKTLNGIPF